EEELGFAQGEVLRVGHQRFSRGSEPRLLYATSLAQTRHGWRIERFWGERRSALTRARNTDCVWGACSPPDSEVHSPANLRAVSVGNHHMAAPSHFAPVL